MFCTKCGAQVPEGTQFCPNCGAPLAAAQQPAYEQPAYQQPVYQQPAGNGYGSYNNAPIKKRSLAACIILSIVTCGIYLYYWLYCMANDLNTASHNPEDTSGVKLILLTIVTCGIYMWVWLYKSGEHLCNAKQYATGYRGENNGILYLVLALFGLGIVSYALIQHELNQIAAY